MNLLLYPRLDASLRAILIGAVAAAIVAIAKWRGQPLAAKPEHALWTCVLAAMLAFAAPKLTVHAGSPMTPDYAPVRAVALQQSDLPALSIPNPTHIAPVSAARPNVWLMIWLAGAGLMAVRIVLGLFLTHRSLADARTITREIPPALTFSAATGIARLQESDNAIVPMTIGWPRTRIVLPTSWQTWPNDKLRAVILHERAHVHRRDALVTFLAAINKAIFWFHPLAWWLERRLAELAEFAADDAAVKASIDPRDYASILIDIASVTRPSRLRLSSDFAQHGINRINRRVERIFDSSARTGSMKIVWTAATLITAMTLVQFQRPIYAQGSGAQQKPLSVDAASLNPDWQTRAGGKMAFEVASVKPTKGWRPPNFPLDIGDAKTPGGRFSATFSLVGYVTFAYKLSPGEVSAQLPKSFPDTFDIEARASGNPTKDQMRLMMQSLLADRFKLRVHFETHEGPVLALTLVRPDHTGPKLRPHADGPACPDSFEMAPGVMPALPRNASDVFPPACGTTTTRGTREGTVVGARDMTVEIIAEETIHGFGSLTGEIDRPVVDQTGLKGRYDFMLQLPPGILSFSFALPNPGTPPADPTGTPYLDAVRKQLGLKLVSSKGPIRKLVIDHAEPPSAN